MNSSASDIAKLIWLIRRLFQRLSADSNAILTAYQLNASQRAVLEFLHKQEPDTLSNIAREHDVSRQHIQQIVNDLISKELVEVSDNPAHKRSFLINRSAKGRRLFSEIQDKEQKLFQFLAHAMNGNDLKASLNTLHELHELLQSEQWQQLIKQ
jgi:DNA-binding MarR family transcriptional regulator